MFKRFLLSPTWVWIVIDVEPIFMASFVFAKTCLFVGGLVLLVEFGSLMKLRCCVLLIKFVLENTPFISLPLICAVVLV